MEATERRFFAEDGGQLHFGAGLDIDRATRRRAAQHRRDIANPRDEDLTAARRELDVGVGQLALLHPDSLRDRLAALFGDRHLDRLIAIRQCYSLTRSRSDDAGIGAYLDVECMSLPARFRPSSRE